jgi:hypothetical protein
MPNPDFKTKARTLKLAWLLALGVLSVIIEPSLWADLITQEMYTEVSSVNHYLEKICPPQDCAVIGLGRSPTPFMAALQAQHADYAWNMPLSNFRYDVAGLKPLKPEIEQKLFQHFERFLPPTHELKGRNLLVIDYSMSGDSIASAKKYLDKYFAARSSTSNEGEPPAEVQALAFVKDDPRNNKYWDESLNQFILLNPQGELAHLIVKQKFDTYAQYGSFDVQRQDSPQVNKTGYYPIIIEEFKKLRARLSFEFNAKTSPVSYFNLRSPSPPSP